MRMLTSLFATVALLCAGMSAQARGSEEILDYHDVAVRAGSGNPASAEQVCAAIVRAVDGARAEDRYPWARLETSSTAIVASLQVRQKHTIRIDIACAPDQYSVTYKDSTNMNYKRKKSAGFIHPYYNVWVQDLVAAIDAELARL